MGRNKRFHKRFAPSWMNVRRPSVAGDTEMIANSMANDYIQTDIAGYVQNKTAWRNEYFKPLAELITAGKSHWEAFDKKDIQIRMYGETAIVIGDKVKKMPPIRIFPRNLLFLSILLPVVRRVSRARFN
jgi:hypothetical protein